MKIFKITNIIKWLTWFCSCLIKAGIKIAYLILKYANYSKKENADGKKGFIHANPSRPEIPKRSHYFWAIRISTGSENIDSRDEYTTVNPAASKSGRASIGRCTLPRRASVHRGEPPRPRGESTGWAARRPRARVLCPAPIATTRRHAPHRETPRRRAPGGGWA